MRIGGVGARPAAASDVASALTMAVTHLGQRPAITDLGSHGRHEQGFLSLSGWAAKGANLLRDEFGLTCGERLGISAPPGWPLAAVTLAAWWLGVTIVPTATSGLRLRVRHIALAGQQAVADDAADDGGEVLWIGDALDGTGPFPAPSGDYWTDAVIPHPDRAPAPTHDGTARALELLPTSDDPAGASTQHQLLGSFSADPGGAVGLVRRGDEDLLVSADAAERLAVLVLRPLVTGAATVVMGDGEERERVTSAERIVRWLD